MSFSTIQYEKSGGVAVLTLCRPERVNAINRTMLGRSRRRWTRSRPTPRCAYWW